MIPQRDAEYLTNLVDNLRRLPSETEWVEFKVNRATDPQAIGEYISALANGATLNDKDTAYMVWGIEDVDHEVVGTAFKPATGRRGNEPLERWLRRGLTPEVDFRFHEVVISGQQVVILEIETTTQQPVAIWGKECIRVGDVKANLRDHPEKERALWQIANKVSFEDGIALEKASDEDVLSSLNYPSYFDLLGRALPNGRAAILDGLRSNGLLLPCDAGGWNITNLGAVLFARNLEDFP
jgi:predicted HTH transcriptional regulator